MINDTARYDPVWRAAEPYMRARKNDIHIPLAFGWAQKILESYPQADRDVCLLAILLHDIGWWSIDIEDIIAKGFRGENPLQSDVRYRHEAEGVRLGTEVLRQTGWSEEIIVQVCEIIDGHDTRKDPHHLNDRIVRDADKLWRYEVSGVAIGADWMGKTPHAIIANVEANLDWFETPEGRAMAERELAVTKKALKFDVL
jgi:HD superfamily phosphodiesterase